MLNRTNRTLSANTNRLNLGTRKLDQNASANIGSLTLRTAHAFTVVTVRTGVVEYHGIPDGVDRPLKRNRNAMKPAMRPAMTGSSPRSSRPAQGFWAWDQGQSAMSSQLAQPALVLRDVAGTGKGAAPRVSPSPRSHTRSSLAWHCDRTRRAGRSARAALALVTGAAPIT